MRKRDFSANKSILLKIKALFFLALILILSGFQVPPLPSSTQISIVTSVFPLKEFAQAVCGDRGDVSLLVPPGAEIHTWQPRPSDIVRLSSADLFLFIGSNMEPWLRDILESVQNPGLRTLEVAKGISLIEKDADKSGIEGETEQEHEHDHETADPHIWLDFQNDQVIVEKIAVALSEIDPDGALIYRENASVYKRRLQELDNRYKLSLQKCTHRVFILGGHAAFGYLAKRYGLHQVSLYGMSPDARPTPKKLIEIVELARKYGINVIFFDSSVSVELARVLAREVGARILILNPGVNLTKDQLESGKTFFDIMEENLENLKDGLLCR